MILFSVNKAQILRNSLVEDKPSHSGFNKLSFVISLRIHSYLDLGMDAHCPGLISHEHFVKIGKDLAITHFCIGVSFLHTRMSKII